MAPFYVGLVVALAALIVVFFQELAHELLTGGGEALLTQLKDEELLRMVALDINSALPEG